MFNYCMISDTIIMATSSTSPSSYEESSTDLEYLQSLLECPICLETIRELPAHNCLNGHIFCKSCKDALNDRATCPMCRTKTEWNKSLLAAKLVKVCSFLVCVAGSARFPSRDRRPWYWQMPPRPQYCLNIRRLWKSVDEHGKNH